MRRLLVVLSLVAACGSDKATAPVKPPPSDEVRLYAAVDSLNAVMRDMYFNGKRPVVTFIALDSATAPVFFVVKR